MSATSGSQPIACNLCGRVNADVLFTASSRNIVRCRNDGLVYTNPWLDGPLYQDETYFTVRNQYISRQAVFRRIFSHILDQIEPHKPGGHLLDIGCGPGLLLDVAQARGWIVDGVEISEWAAKFAQEEFGLPVLCGEFKQDLFPPASFDVIVLNHSLEHMPDPKSILKMIRPILRDDGILVVGVPNFACLMSGLLKKRWSSLLPDQHRWHFTPDTLERLLNTCGYAVISTKMERYTYWGHNPVKRMITFIFSWFLMALRTGEAMLVVARK